MKKFTAFALVELVLIAAGALGDRMIPDVPTYVLGATIAVLLAVSAALFLWALRGDSKGRDDLRKMLREELSAKDVQIAKLKEVARKLPQKPLGDGHTYAQLPDGTNIVSMADGTVRLALPIRVSAGESSHKWSTSQPSVTHRRASEKDTCDDV